MGRLYWLTLGLVELVWDGLMTGARAAELGRRLGFWWWMLTNWTREMA